MDVGEKEGKKKNGEGGFTCMVRKEIGYSLVEMKR
jgi:hypothetical protein